MRADKFYLLQLLALNKYRALFFIYYFYLQLWWDLHTVRASFLFYLFCRLLNYHSG